jgi:hypothetical protein
MKKIDVIVQPLPPGVYHDVATIQAPRCLTLKNPVVFVVHRGKVYVAGRTRMDLSSHHFNDTIRRAWCKAADVPMIKLKLAIQAHRQEQARIAEDMNLSALQRRAERLGYTLVKAK